MFSLLITIISVALVAALALATLYYGNGAYVRYQDAAILAKFYNEQQQIQGAAALYTTDNQHPPATLADLVAGGYLRNPPEGDWTFSDGYTVSLASVPDNLCLAYNRKQNINLIPRCDDPAYADQAVCCTG